MTHSARLSPVRLLHQLMTALSFSIFLHASILSFLFCVSSGDSHVAFGKVGCRVYLTFWRRWLVDILEIGLVDQHFANEFVGQICVDAVFCW